MSHILVVEDEPKIAQLVIDYLDYDDYESTCFNTGKGVVSWVKENKPDLVLLDLMLPEKDGLSICREIRAFSMVPIVMLTARVEEIDRIIGLEVGADDYICKPFSPREVVARVKSLLRRVDYHLGQQSRELQSQSGLQLDKQQFLAQFNGETIDLTPVEFRLLVLLAEHPGRVYARQHLLDHIYDDGRVVTNRTIDTHVKNMRKKLHKVGIEEEQIRSIYGVGYKWVGL